MYIQPCCIEKEIPQLMRKQPFSFFQSNGDWTVQDLLKAVGSLVPHAVCLLAIPEADVFLLRTLRTYLSKGWLRALVLVTSTPQGELVKQEMGSMLPLMTYASHDQVQDGLLALTDFGRFLVVQGGDAYRKGFLALPVCRVLWPVVRGVCFGSGSSNGACQDGGVHPLTA